MQGLVSDQAQGYTGFLNLQGSSDFHPTLNDIEIPSHFTHDVEDWEHTN